jgi:hypothetical protein
MRLLLLLVACNPTFTDRPSVISGPRLLAVKGTPAEARPGDTVGYTLLVAGADPAMAQWKYCNTPKPLDENNIVAAGCLDSSGPELPPIGSGASVSAALPLNACQLFGPDPPPPMQGKPPLRPRDPDVSGGYYQPLRIDDSGAEGFGLQRITCNLAAAGAEIAIDFAKRYLPNQNPTLADVAIPELHVGQTVTFTASWPPESVETYPVYDLTALALVDHREAMRVSWFATGGSFEHDRTGRGETEMETSTDNAWTAPKDAGMVTMWVVLRDSRGGVDWRQFTLAVAP